MIGSFDGAGWRCIGHNPQSGVSTWIKPDGDEDVLIQERQDVSALLDENAAIRNMTESGWKGDGLHSVARIPSVMAYEKGSYLHDALSAQDSKAIATFLNDSDNAKLRTKDGVL